MLSNRHLTSLNVATHRRDPRAPHSLRYRIGCVVAGLLLACVLYMVATTR